MDWNPLAKIELRDVFYLTSLVISAISLFISGYWNSLRGAKFTTVAPRFVIYLYVIDKQDFLILPITIANVGAQIGVVDSLYLKVTKSAYENEPVFYAVSDGEGLEEFFKHVPLTDIPYAIPFTEPSLGDLPRPFVLKPGESQTKYLSFIAPTDWDLSLSIKKLTVYGNISAKKKPQKLLEQGFKIQNLPTITSYAQGFNLVPSQTLTLGKFPELNGQ
ncbi:hypothetical protein H6F95_28200 [Cyanobacteria bacterium FACHB-471]|jgi:hypothetical protein|nr:hypothetical protein [Cyanobacteria bacterium FACHB-471]